MLIPPSASSWTHSAGYVVGWMVAPRETAELAKRLIANTCDKQNIQPEQLTIPFDRGSSMTSKPVAFLLADLSRHQIAQPPLCFR